MYNISGFRMFLFLTAGMFPAKAPTVWEKGLPMAFRSFFKPAGTNSEIEGPFYELSSWVVIFGHSNFEALALGFKKGSNFTKMSFRPIDPTKPIVLAIDSQRQVGFVVIDHHLEEGAEAGMRDYNFHKSDDFHIDCERRDVISGGREY